MISPQLIEQGTRHAVYVERVKSHEANQFAAFLKRIDADIRRRLEGKTLTNFSRKRLEQLLSYTEASLTQIFADHYDDLAGHLIEFGEYEAGFEARSIDNVLVNCTSAIPAQSQVRAAILTNPMAAKNYRGTLLEPFIKDWHSKEVKFIVGAVRQGVFEGQTTPEIIQSIRGTKKNKYRDGLLNITNRNAGAIVRTAAQHVANTARAETWKENSRVVSGYRIVATLDSRTSQTCRSLDGRVFKIDNGPLPPFHINCRSTTVAELDGRYSKLMEGATRASSAGHVPASETYYQWLKRQPVGFQKDAIGPTRAKLLRDGGLSSERFARMNLGREFQPLTIKEMMKKEPVAFERAGL